MITIQDWIATVPEEDRHLAYMGEHQSVIRQFLLTGEGWQDYKDWGFHLDMAFDLSTVTTRDTRQLENVKVESSETVSDTLVKTSASTKKEKYTVSDVSVDCHSTTDVAYLEKSFTDDGVLLIWRVLRQHTQLPGRLWANIRALGENGEVKKSSVMVFDVGASVDAEAAADLPQSEWEAMEQHMDEMLDAVLKNAQTVEECTADTEEYMDTAKDCAERAEDALLKAQNLTFDMDSIRTQVQQIAADNVTQSTAISGLTYDMEDLCISYAGGRYQSAGEAVRSQVGGAMMDIGRLRARVTALEESAQTVDEKIQAAEGRLDDLNARLTQVETKLNTLWLDTYDATNEHSAS